MKHADSPIIYPVSVLNRMTSTLLCEHFGVILVSGEISNLSRPSSGHLYFSLKDQDAQIRCALFRFQHGQINFALENGQDVIVRAQVSLYEPRGDYQLIVSDVQLAGAGKLQIAFEQLKKELEKQGFFDETQKKPLPLFPKCIGIITSPTAAALQDILKVLRRRMPSIPILIYPTQTQGDLAAAQISAAIARANRDKTCDVLILARGGGSLEDLWCFNEKSVAKALFQSNIPIVTGIGHQTDFTIADFVADFRAPTPSAAAECVTPDRAELSDQLSHYYQRLLQHVHAQMKSHRDHLFYLQKRLQHPGAKIQQQAQQLDQLDNNLCRIMRYKLQFYSEKIAHYSQLLDNLSPLKVLQRGFSITRNQITNRVIVHCNDATSGDRIITRVSDGEIASVIV